MYSLLFALIATLTVPIPLVLASTNQTTGDDEKTKHVDEEALALIKSTEPNNWDEETPDDWDDDSDSGDVSTVSSSNDS